MRKSVWFTLLILLTYVPAFSQNVTDSIFIKLEDIGNHLLYKDHDSTYIESYAEDLNLRLLAINKYSFFYGKDKIDDAFVRYRPERQLNLGLGIAYKWFSLDLAFNVGIEENTDLKNNNFLDFQGNIFSSKQFVSASLQYYYGYQLVDYNGFQTPYTGNIPRDDIRTILVSLQYLFAVNYDKFSIKAPFILNEVQKKSAGSVLFGASFKMYVLDADSALAPHPSEAVTDFPVTDINNLRFGLNAGYMYTFIIAKNFFITLSAIPELGFNMGDYREDFRNELNNQLTIGYKTMNAIGYNSDRFYMGVQSLNEAFIIKINDQFTVSTNNGKFKGFIGYRFGRKEK